MRIGLLSDTHLPASISDLDHLGRLRAEVLGSVDLILHAGDVGAAGRARLVRVLRPRPLRAGRPRPVRGPSLRPGAGGRARRLAPGRDARRGGGPAQRALRRAATGHGVRSHRPRHPRGRRLALRAARVPRGRAADRPGEPGVPPPPNDAPGLRGADRVDPRRGGRRDREAGRDARRAQPDDPLPRSPSSAVACWAAPSTARRSRPLAGSRAERRRSPQAETPGSPP